MTVNAHKDHEPKISKTAYIDDSAKITGDVTIEDNVSVWPMSVIRGDVDYIKIGERTNIQDACVLHGSPDSDFYPDGRPVIVGKNVTVGHKSILHGCTIGNYCLIGMGSIILDGAKLEDELVIGAGSLVPPHKKLETGYLYFGSPVKQIRTLNEKEKELIKYSADYYVQLKDDLL